MKKYLFIGFIILSTALNAGSILDNSINMETLKKEMNHFNYLSLDINNELLGASQSRLWNVRWERIKGLLNWKGLKVLDIGCYSGLNLICLKKYAGVAEATGVDLRVRNLDALSKVFETDVNFFQLNIDREGCEEALGYDYDVVFVMSVYRWVKNKKKLMNYLSEFPMVVYEAHKNLSVKEHIALFQGSGFDNFILLNEHPKEENHRSDMRPMFLFYKSGYEHLINDQTRN